MTKLGSDRVVVIDTNIVLDLLVFDDSGARGLKSGLARGQWTWIATRPMREEFERVLSYPQILPRLGSCGLRAGEVLAGFDRQALLVESPAKAMLTCSDADDQKFIDLAIQHRCMLLSRDGAVLSMARRLAQLGVTALTAIPDSSYRLIDP